MKIKKYLTRKGGTGFLIRNILLNYFSLFDFFASSITLKLPYSKCMTCLQYSLFYFINKFNPFLSTAVAIRI